MRTQKVISFQLCAAMVVSGGLFACGGAAGDLTTSEDSIKVVETPPQDEFEGGEEEIPGDDDPGFEEEVDLSNEPKNTLFLLQNGRYRDIIYQLTPRTIRNPQATWRADGNTLTLFASPDACANSVAIVQCQPEPNAYSHYVTTRCVSGRQPTEIGVLGYVCPAINGQCPRGSSQLHSGTHSGFARFFPFVNGVNFVTSLITKNLSVLEDNGEIDFSPIIPFGCAP